MYKSVSSKIAADPPEILPNSCRPLRHMCEPDRAPLTCLSLSCSILARRFLSGGDRYFCVSNFFSSSMVWSLEKRTWPPFLLCKGRWMNGVHSRGFPVERSHRMHRVWNTWNKTKYLFLAVTNLPAVEKEATAYKPSCCHLTWNELTKHASTRQKHGTFVLCYIRPTDGIFTHVKNVNTRLNSCDKWILSTWKYKTTHFKHFH